MRRSRALLALAAVTGVLVAPLTAAAAASASAATYYVDCSRSGPGVGTRAAPWRSLAAINSHGAFRPGERILLKRNTTCRGRLAPSGSGTSASRITLGAFGSGAKPKIVGGGTRDRTGAVTLTNQQYWTVQDLDVSNSTAAKTTPNYRSGVLLQNQRAGTTLHGITVQRLTVHAVTSNMGHTRNDPREWGGISALTFGDKGDGFTGLRLLDNRIDHVGRTGIMVSNHAYPNGGDVAPRVSGNRITWTRGDGLVVRGSTDARIDHNVVAHASNQWPCPQCGRISPHTANAAIWTAASKRTRIDHNEAYATRYLGGDGEGFDIDASAVDTVMEYNYSHDNEGGGVIFCSSKNATVRFNIFENNQKSAIAFIGSMPSTNTSISNNTIYASRATNAKTVRYFNGPHGKGIKFVNNIVYNFGRGGYMWPTKVWSRSNTYIGSHGANEPRGSGYSLAAPGLKNPGTGKTGRSTLAGYRPLHPSSFRKGIAISSKVTTDFFGKHIDPKRPPRGAAG